MGLSVQGGIVLRFLGAQRLLRRNRNVGEDSEMEQVLCVNVMCAYVSSRAGGTGTVCSGPGSVMSFHVSVLLFSGLVSLGWQCLEAPGHCQSFLNWI